MDASAHPQAFGRTLYHATSTSTADAIVRDLVIMPKLDVDASLPGREVYKVYLATSSAIISAIPHATTVVEVEIPADVRLFAGEGDDPAKSWREFVYQAPDSSAGLPVTTARVV
jgi:hypothetical protein